MLLHPRGRNQLVCATLALPRILMEASPPLLKVHGQKLLDACKNALHVHRAPRLGGVLRVRNRKEARGRALPRRADRPDLALFP
eukprot:7199358-Lingulodinium_polyedra.AAC.1